MEHRRPQKKSVKEKPRKELATPAAASIAAAVNEDGDEEDEEVASGGGAGADKKRRSSSTLGAKRGIAGGSDSGGVSPPCCQAEKCAADLTEAKRYHRRHKVCEVHSKATVVIVAGLQQRFCQQCSRFHEISEFDDSKRSCRRRLAGHNERRRKSSSDSQGESLNSCRPGDHERRNQKSNSGNSTFKHFQIR